MEIGSANYLIAKSFGRKEVQAELKNMKNCADKLAEALDKLFTTDGVSFHKSAIESFSIDLTEWKREAQAALREFRDE